METAIQLHIAELTESLRELYVTAYIAAVDLGIAWYRQHGEAAEGIFGDYLTRRPRIL